MSLNVMVVELPMQVPFRKDLVDLSLHDRCVVSEYGTFEFVKGRGMLDEATPESRFSMSVSPAITTLRVPFCTSLVLLTPT